MDELSQLEEQQEKAIKEYKRKQRIVNLNDLGDFAVSIVSKIKGETIETVMPIELLDLAKEITERKKKIDELKKDNSQENKSLQIYYKNPILRFFANIVNRFSASAHETSMEMFYEELEKKAKLNDRLLEHAIPARKQKPPVWNLSIYDNSQKNRKTNEQQQTQVQEVDEKNAVDIIENRKDNDNFLER